MTPSALVEYEVDLGGVGTVSHPLIPPDMTLDPSSSVHVLAATSALLLECNYGHTQPLPLTHPQPHPANRPPTDTLLCCSKLFQYTTRMAFPPHANATCVCI